MKTFIIVKASSERYHVYNGAGKCVAVASSKQEVIKLLVQEVSNSTCIECYFRYTAVDGTYILTMK